MCVDMEIDDYWTAHMWTTTKTACCSGVKSCHTPVIYIHIYIHIHTYIHTYICHVHTCIHACHRHTHTYMTVHTLHGSSSYWSCYSYLKP